MRAKGILGASLEKVTLQQGSERWIDFGQRKCCILLYFHFAQDLSVHK